MDALYRKTAYQQGQFKDATAGEAVKSTLVGALLQLNNKLLNLHLDTQQAWAR